MSKIEERHDADLIKAIETIEGTSLANVEAFLEEAQKPQFTLSQEQLKKTEKLLKEEVKNDLDSFELKIEGNYQRKKRYHHVDSTNYKVGKSKTQELEERLDNHGDTPDKALLKKEFQDEFASALNPLPLKVRATFTTYYELGYYPKHENFTNLVRVLKSKGIKTTDKTVKKYVTIARKHLSNHYSSFDF